MIVAIILFVIGAILGLNILINVLKNNPTPKVSVLLHGLFVAVALIIVIIAVAGGKDVTSTLIVSLIFFLVAALGGFVMVLIDLGKKQLPPKGLAILHPILAAIGLVLLIIFTVGR